MTGPGKIKRAELDRLTELLVDDILAASDDDILSEFQETHGDPDINASEMRALFEQSLIASNKKRLAAAKAAVARGSLRSMKPTPTQIDAKTARVRVREMLNSPGLSVAARKESELSDNDILGMLEDLEELGISISDDPSDNDSGGQS